MAEPGFGAVFTDHMATIRWSDGAGLARRPAGALRPGHPGPGGGGLPLRPGDLRGPEGLHAVRRHASARSARRPTRPGSTGRRPGWRCRSCRRRRSSTAHRGCWSARTAPGCPAEAGTKPLPAAVHDRHAARPRRQPAVVDLPVHRHRLPGGGLLRRGRARSRCGCRTDYTRAAPGGTGEAKCGGNYAAAFAGQHQALEHGCDQVVWLDAAERQWVEEMGGMNLFFVYGSGSEARMMTPAPTGSLLHGITRDSLLKLGPDLGHPDPRGPDLGGGVAGRLRVRARSPRCSRAARPPSSRRSARCAARPRTGRSATGRPARWPRRLREELVGIQYGTRPDPYGWIHPLCA